MLRSVHPTAAPIMGLRKALMARRIRGSACMLVTMTRNEITEQIVVARLAKGLTWQELADAIGRPVVWTTSALLGQHPIPAELGKVLVAKLGLDESAVAVLAAPPMRGGLPTTGPTDPTIYRLYEGLPGDGGADKKRHP